MMLCGLIFILYLALLVSAAPQLEERQSLARVVASCTVPNTVALTFDDGPYDYIYDLNKILKSNNAVGTFFFNGNNSRCIYSAESIQRTKFIYDQGHMVASHTWSHKNLTQLTWDQIHDEMWKVELALLRITGASPAFIRPPYGAYNNLVRQAASMRGQSVAIWDFDSGDSTGTTATQSKALYADIAIRRPTTILTINHETRASTVYDVVPYAIQQLRAKGYTFVSLAQCLGVAPYQSVQPPQIPTVDWKC